MIKTDVLFDNIDDFVCAWVPNGVEATELAKISDLVVAKKIQFLSLPAAAVETVWPWVESGTVKILTRIDFGTADISDKNVSEFATRVTDAFRHGTYGIQVFLHYVDLAQFVDVISVLRNDLFFERYFSVAINVDEVPSNDWDSVFDSLKRVRPNSVLITANGDSFNPKSDFLGRAYSMLIGWDSAFALHIMFGKNMMRVSQMLRLVQKMQPKLLSDFCVFIAPPQE